MTQHRSVTWLTGITRNKLDLMSQDSQKLFQDVLGQCASYQLRRAARLTTNAFNDMLKPTGLRSTQVAVLLGAGAYPERSISSLAEKLSLDVSTLQRSLSVLEKQGLVKLAKGHQREKKVSLTEEGLKKASEAKPYWAKAQEKFLEAFGHDEWKNFLQASGCFCEGE